MKRILIGLVLGAAMVSGAGAADIGKLTERVDSATPSGTAVNWTGIYVGGQVGYGTSNHKLSASETERHCKSLTNTLATDGKCYLPTSVDSTGKPKTGAIASTTDTVVSNELASAFIDGINSDGIFGGGTIGFDYQINRIVVGIFGDYDFGNGDAKAGVAFGKNSADASIEDGDSWLIAARLGYLFGDEKRALLYILGGYGQQDVSYNAGTNKVGSKDLNKDVTFSGFIAGAGAEYALTQNVFIGLEYQHFFGGKEDLVNEDKFSPIAISNSRIGDDMDSDKVMAKLKVKLNGGLFGY